VSLSPPLDSGVDPAEWTRYPFLIPPLRIAPLWGIYDFLRRPCLWIFMEAEKFRLRNAAQLHRPEIT
jgi:hypothetical protein